MTDATTIAPDWQLQQDLIYIVKVFEFKTLNAYWFVILDEDKGTAAEYSNSQIAGQLRSSWLKLHEKNKIKWRGCGHNKTIF